MRGRAGRELFGVELRIVDDEGNELPRDGTTPGEVQARGPWVAGGYYELDDPSTHEPPEAGGWLRTGDVDDTSTLEPKYFRGPAITKPKPRRVTGIKRK